jgi:hypothetical protein
VLQQRTEERLQELLSEGNYPGAIGLLLECQSAAATYRHFMCVVALSGKLQDTLEMAEEQLDRALAKVAMCDLCFFTASRSLTLLSQSAVLNDRTSTPSPAFWNMSI